MWVTVTKLFEVDRRWNIYTQMIKTSRNIEIDLFLLKRKSKKGRFSNIKKTYRTYDANEGYRRRNVEEDKFSKFSTKGL